jgi:shikimate dehydrogenase
MPDRYVLIGSNVSNSPTPNMMNAAFRAMGSDAEYDALDVDATLLDTSFAKLKSSGVSGLNVTIPHKATIISHLDSLDEVPRSIGAVNTVKKVGSGYRGFNTDVDGVLEPLKSRGVSKIRSAFVLGAGGASRAACKALYELGCRELTVLTRNIEKTTEFISFMSSALPKAEVKAAPVTEPPAGAPELIFNASAVGTYGIPLPAQLLPLLEGRPIVFDAVYLPVETELIRHATEKHCITIHGHEMLLHQGAKAFQIWTGSSPQVQVMKTALLQSIGVEAGC